MSNVRDFLLDDDSTIDQIDSIELGTTRLMVGRITRNVYALLEKLPHHMTEVEILIPHSIRYLRSNQLPRFMNTLVVSRATEKEVVAPWSKTFTRVRVLKNTSPYIIAALNKSITEMDLDEDVSMHSLPAIEDFPKHITTVRYYQNDMLDEYMAKLSQKLTHLQTVAVNTFTDTITEVISVTKTITHVRTPGSPSLKKSREVDEKSLERAAKRFKNNNSEVVEKPIVIDLTNEKNEEVKAQQPEKEAADLDEVVEIPSMPIIQKGVSVKDVQAMRCKIVEIGGGASSSQLRKVWKGVARFELNEDANDTLALDFPDLLQVKFLHGASGNFAPKLKWGLSLVVVSSSTPKTTIDKINRNFSKTPIMIAVAIEEDASVFSQINQHSPSVEYVEIDENTSIEAARNLDNKKIKAVLLGRNVKPEVVAAIHANIKMVKIGLEVSKKAAEAIPLFKAVECLQGVEVDEYLELIRMEVMEAKNIIESINLDSVDEEIFESLTSLRHAEPGWMQMFPAPAATPEDRMVVDFDESSNEEYKPG